MVDYSAVMTSALHEHFVQIRDPSEDLDEGDDAMYDGRNSDDNVRFQILPNFTRKCFICSIDAT